ncbi:hypothetical protein GCM10025869_28950 [Homoserinibacter gongjuensis]|uniref:Uncharacterized protein n=1 Tax=Homoserinibacter gongjuensis TaxID=1162968 RepID=A0ABQ6JVM7_9MICO|nr:hypothetical protein GCM10025869_28950 [Homoserinibacter gongjuensis]
MTVVIVAPGQGSQTPGFLDPWLAESRFATHLEELSDAAGVDLGRHGTASDADTIRDTAVAQPLIVGASLISSPPCSTEGAATGSPASQGTRSARWPQPQAPASWVKPTRCVSSRPVAGRWRMLLRAPRPA